MFFVQEKNYTFDEFLKNYQNEYIESKGEIVDEICCGIGIKTRSKYLKLKNSSIFISKRTVALNKQGPQQLF